MKGYFQGILVRLQRTNPESAEFKSIGGEFNALPASVTIFHIWGTDEKGKERNIETSRLVKVGKKIPGDDAEHWFFETLYSQYELIWSKNG